MHLGAPSCIACIKPWSCIILQFRITLKTTGRRWELTSFKQSNLMGENYQRLHQPAKFLTSTASRSIPPFENSNRMKSWFSSKISETKTKFNVWFCFSLKSVQLLSPHNERGGSGMQNLILSNLFTSCFKVIKAVSVCHHNLIRCKRIEKTVSSPQNGKTPSTRLFQNGIFYS